jgi:hypothetical protein
MVARGAYHGLYIELKRRHGGKVTPEQREWIDDLSKQGYAAIVCHGFDEAVSVIEEYLRGAKWNQSDLLEWIAAKQCRNGANE